MVVYGPQRAHSLAVQSHSALPSAAGHTWHRRRIHRIGAKWETQGPACKDWQHEQGTEGIVSGGKPLKQHHKGLIHSSIWCMVIYCLLPEFNLNLQLISAHYISQHIIGTAYSHVIANHGTSGALLFTQLNWLHNVMHKTQQSQSHQGTL